MYIYIALILDSNVFIDRCDPNPCQNNGSCTDFKENYNCTCTDGWKGENCTIGEIIFAVLFTMFKKLMQQNYLSI